VVLTPFLVVFSGHGAGNTRIVVLGALVGLLSSVIPYSCEITALRTIRPSLFGILMSLEPGAAALAGILVVHEFLGAVQWLALACVVVASVGATRAESRLTEPAPD
jgi:inner membrane transporter RhtA